MQIRCDPPSRRRPFGGAIAAGWLLGLFGCQVGPDYARPPTAVTQLNTYLHAPVPGGTSGMTAWWQRLDDPLLTHYIGLLEADNPELQEAAARVAQAWQQRVIQGGNRYPSLAVGVTANRFMQPLTATEQIPVGITEASPGTGTTLPERFYVSLYETSLATAWQLDLFGKIRRSMAAAQAMAWAAAADRDALVHALIAELVQRRVAIAAVQRQLELTAAMVRTYTDILRITERRYALGTSQVIATDIYLARENLASAQADLPRLRQELRRHAYELDILLGQPPGTFDPLQTSLPLLPPPMAVAVELPASLLDRRPDLRSAELRLIAATEQIGVAIADIYPQLTLRASLGLQSNQTNQWLASEQLASSILGELATTLFAGGSRRANVRLARARANELAANYAATILAALKEVEVALGQHQAVQQRLEYLDVSVQAIRRAESLAVQRYERGVGDLLPVLEIQRRRLVAEQNQITAQQALWNARIALYLALGGDW